MTKGFFCNFSYWYQAFDAPIHKNQKGIARSWLVTLCFELYHRHYIRKGSLVHEPPATVRFGEGKLYATLIPTSGEVGSTF